MPEMTTQWFDWALNRGTQGVLMLACALLVTILFRLHKEKNALHKAGYEREKKFQDAFAKREREFQEALADQTAKSHEQHVELEADFRDKVEQLLREQVKIVRETGRVLVQATDVLRNLHIVDGPEHSHDKPGEQA